MKLLTVLSLFGLVQSKIYFKEEFDSDWKDRWTEAKQDSPKLGKWKHTAGEWFGDKEDKGIQTSEDARFYALSAKMDHEVNNLDKPLIIQYTVKHEQKIDCGGAYIKLLKKKDFTPQDFNGKSDYGIMFGPDICGSSTRRTHLIFNYKGENLLSNKEITVQTDQLSHVYTMILNPDNTYDVKIDGASVTSGSIFDNWNFLLPREIQDPSKSKPSDWVDTKTIPDANDVKPANYDDIPEQIPDKSATKPEDWDEEDDGEWEPPLNRNPDYKGPWVQKQIPNPAYKGEWVHPLIPNPDFVDDKLAYNVCKDCAYVGFELWQVKSGTIFDDIIVTDSQEEADAFLNATWKAKKDGEKVMFDKAEEARKKKEAEEVEKANKRAEEEAAKAAKKDESNDDWEKDEL